MLKSRIKRLFGIILTLFLCVGIVNPVYASDDNFVNEEMAYQIAVNFALGNTKDIIQTDAEGDLAAHEIAYIEEGYPNEFIVYEIEPFYDYNENISAYNIGYYSNNFFFIISYQPIHFIKLNHISSYNHK